MTDESKMGTKANFLFSLFSADHEKDQVWQPYPVDAQNAERIGKQTHKIPRYNTLLRRTYVSLSITINLSRNGYILCKCSTGCRHRKSENFGISPGHQGRVIEEDARRMGKCLAGQAVACSANKPEIRTSLLVAFMFSS